MAKKITTECKHMPSFAPAFDLAPFWDDETDKPRAFTPYDLEDAEEHASLKAAVAQYAAWRRIVEDPAEAEARQAYAEHAARHLLGIFPGVRVSVDAYASVAADELAVYGADVVRAVALHVRRKAKTLPPVSGLVDLAESITARRMAIHEAHLKAMRAHAAALAAGRAEAQRIADAMAATGAEPALTADQVLRLWLVIVGVADMGVELPQGQTRQELEPLARALLQRLAAGDMAAATHAHRIVAQREAMNAEHLDVTRTAPDLTGRWIAGEKIERALVAELPAILGLPEPRSW